VYEFIHAERATFSVKTMCRVLGVSRGAYYEWATEVESAHGRRDSELLDMIKIAFTEHRGRYGAPRVHAVLRRRGVGVSRKRVARLMRESGLRARSAKKFKATTDSAHSMPVWPDLLQRNFSAPRPDVAWASDITYIWTAEGWLYLCVILDLCSRKVVGWALRERMAAGLVCEAFDAARSIRQPRRGLLFHSDRGSQYASRKFRRRLARIGACQSMSRKGDCWDNAVAESFFATLKKELVRDRTFTTRAEAQAAVFEYIEVFYNRRRIHSLLGNTSPTDFESCLVMQLAA
jgi:transposase InsO family protein